MICFQVVMEDSGTENSDKGMCDKMRFNEDVNDHRITAGCSGSRS